MSNHTNEAGNHVLLTYTLLLMRVSAYTNAFISVRLSFVALPVLVIIVSLHLYGQHSVPTLHRINP